MAGDWSPAEDLRPGAPFSRVVSTGGRVYTVPMTLTWQLPETDKAVACWTWFTVRECNGDVIIEDRRVYATAPPEDDGA